MATMYEVIMDLPLFKGVSKDQVSLFLEKTNVEFVNYADGDLIISKGSGVGNLRFVISGSVRVTHSLDSLPMTIEEVCSGGNVFGADRLFGISREYPYEVRAVGAVSVMQFSKEQYISLLGADEIYMLNFFNYLSLKGQRPVESAIGYSVGDLRQRLSLLISVLTLPKSSQIIITATTEALSRYGNLTEREVKEWKKKMTKAGLVTCSGDRMLIKSRRDFLSQ